MSKADTLTSLVDQVPPEARPELLRLLRQLKHNLTTPISTLAMEVYSAQLLLERLRSSLGESRRPEDVRTVSELEEICNNIERVSSALASSVSALSEAVAAEDR